MPLLAPASVCFRWRLQLVWGIHGPARKVIPASVFSESFTKHVQPNVRVVLDEEQPVFHGTPEEKEKHAVITPTKTARKQEGIAYIPMAAFTNSSPTSDKGVCAKCIAGTPTALFSWLVCYRDTQHVPTL